MARLSWSEVRERAVRFSRSWEGTDSERAEKQTFWNEFFEVFGIPRRSVAAFEVPVRNLKGNLGSIDLFWRGKVLVEHKSRGQDLGNAESQAFTYVQDLTRAGKTNEIPRFVLVSDFERFALYDLDPPKDRPDALPSRDRPLFFRLEELHKHVRAFAFMLGQESVRVDPEDPANQDAYDLMCKLHDSLDKGGFRGDELERLLVRVLFCLFAEDTGLFPPDSFTAFVRDRTREDGSDLGAQLNHLFEVLNTHPDRRPRGLSEELAAFPYVNGQLFAERLGFPTFTGEMREKLLECAGFFWARISPAVFGSLFQGILDGPARRQQGAHYTSEPDILKVVKALFLDDLRGEFERLRADRSTRRVANLRDFHKRLRTLRFLDPACGCGNFLVIAYRELRALELDVAQEMTTKVHGDARALQQMTDIRELLAVDVDQFYGIERGEWPVRIAEVAMWLTDHQMNTLASQVLGQYFERLPLVHAPTIRCANALRVEWNEVLPRDKCTFILGNPPFVGKQFRDASQREDMQRVFASVSARGVAGYGDLDYVTAWYIRAAQYIQGTRIRVGFVSTNSVSQGEQVAILWSTLFQRFRIKIHFAHRTFSWWSEARGRASVHVVIVGFAAYDIDRKPIFDYERVDSEDATVSFAKNVSPYLVSGGD